MRALMWFRSDLRMRDNPALHAAAKRARRGVVAVYTICPEQWRGHDMASVKVDFVLRNLRSLSAGLADRGIALRIVETPDFGGVPAALQELAATHECDALFFNREHELNERLRDEAVTEAFETAGATVHAFTDQCVFEPGELRTGEGRFYTVYSPFKRAWYKAFDADRDRGKPLALPARQDELVGEPDPVPETVAGFDPASARPDLWPDGEDTARRRLSAFVKQRLDAYQDQRDLPAVNGTSVLSPYLVSGVVSLRQCVHAALAANDGRLESGSATRRRRHLDQASWPGGSSTSHVMVGFPRVSQAAGLSGKRPRPMACVHENGEPFEAWCNGTDGDSRSSTPACGSFSSRPAGCTTGCAW